MSSTKHRLTLPAAALPDLLTDLAARIAAGEVPTLDARSTLEDVDKVELSFEPAGGSVEVKVKVKAVRQLGPVAAAASPRPPSRAPAPDVGDSYEDLKKAMNKPWKRLRAAASAGRIPAAGDVAELVALSERMVSFPGKGDEHYPAYMAAVRALGEARAPSDAAAAVRAIDRIKKDCHALYK